jgi:hypothetical protein
LFKDKLRVTTPYNIDCLKALLHDHPNPLFVQSVLQGLCKGFWMIDEGNWPKDWTSYKENYSSKDEDLATIEAYADKEIAAGNWSEIDELVAGMTISPIFIVWQGENKDKARVVTNHTGSGLNSGISDSSAKVAYNDM